MEEQIKQLNEKVDKLQATLDGLVLQMPAMLKSLRYVDYPIMPIGCFIGGGIKNRIELPVSGAENTNK